MVVDERGTPLQVARQTPGGIEREPGRGRQRDAGDSADTERDLHRAGLMPRAVAEDPSVGREEVFVFLEQRPEAQLSLPTQGLPSRCGALQLLFYLGYSYLGVLAAIQGYQWLAAGSEGFVSYLRLVGFSADVQLRIDGAVVPGSRTPWGDGTFLCDGSPIEMVVDLPTGGVLVGCAPDTFLGGGQQTCRKLLDDGAIGRPVAGTAFMLSHGVETWHPSPDFYYEVGGGPMFDMGPYYLTALVNMLGPAKRVSAMLSIVTPQRDIPDKGKIKVTEEDNAMVLLDHGQGVISHVQSGFNYFNPHGHDGSGERRHTITVVGSGGFMGLVGYDWAPLGVDLATRQQPKLERHATDTQGYLWQQGAALAAQCLVTGRELLVTPEHALHVLEIITAARESQKTGRRIALTSTFQWPVPV